MKDSRLKAPSPSLGEGAGPCQPEPCEGRSPPPQPAHHDTQVTVQTQHCGGPRPLASATLPLSALTVGLPSGTQEAGRSFSAL